MRHVDFIDQTGLHALTDTLRILHHNRNSVVLSGMNSEVHDKMIKNDVIKYVSQNDICDAFAESMDRAISKLVHYENNRED